MVPLKTIQGFSADKIRGMVGARAVYIWGGGELAHAVLISLQKSGIICTGFLNTNVESSSENQFGLSLLAPEDVVDGRGSIFIVIATQNFKRQASTFCNDSGLENNIDYTSYLNISRPEAVIDITPDAGCVEQKKKPYVTSLETGDMGLDTYNKVLNKLNDDYPLLTKISISEWGEPLRHKHLPEIVRVTRSKNILCSIKTHLLVVNNVDELLDSEPTSIDVVVLGVGSNYDKHTGLGCWVELLNNIETLGSHSPNGHRNTVISVRYAPLKNDNLQIVNVLKSMCQEYQFVFVEEDTYIMPYDRLLDLIEQNGSDIGDNEAVKEIPWDVVKWTEIALRDAKNPCLPQRIFPIINSDASVGLCHIYKEPKVQSHFLDISKDELLNQRHNHEHCVNCQSYGMHRLDLHVLRRKYPLECNDKISDKKVLQ